MTEGKRKLRDRLYVSLLGVAIAALAFVWGYDAPPPQLMDDLAAAAGLRPPTSQFSLLWHHLAGSLCSAIGLKGAEAVLRVAGHVSLGLLAVMAVSMFSRAIPSSFGRGGHIASWWRTAMRFVLFQGAALFCFSNPVWSAFRWFSPLALQTLLAMMAAMSLMEYFKTNRTPPLMASFMLTGILAVDVPTSILLPLAAVAALLVMGRLGESVVSAPTEAPLSSELMKWRLTLLFALGVIVGVALEAMAFASMDGLAAFGWTWGDYVYRTLMAFVKSLLSSCSPAGVVLFIAVALLPVVVEHRLVRRALDEERMLSYSHGATFLVCGLIAFTQLAWARELWFWSLGGAEGCVRDGFLRCVAMFLCALAVVWALAVFTTELLFRNWRRVATLRSQDEAESKTAPEM
ncbi:MAG: hypothetical protein IJI73_09930, partial [Kiritimatiellae bacterium]|nr:hypothetical protein [Kiritimatiellia bacterium]